MPEKKFVTIVVHSIFVKVKFVTKTSVQVNVFMMIKLVDISVLINL